MENNNMCMTFDTEHIVIPTEEYRKLIRIQVEFENIIRVINSPSRGRYMSAEEWLLSQYKVPEKEEEESE